MSLSKFLSRIQLLFPTVPAHTPDKKREMAEKLVSQYAEGNVSLHRRKYLTEEDVKDWKIKITSYNFIAS